MDASAIFNITALIFSFAAVVISIISAQRQATDARRGNYISFISELGQRLRSPEFLSAQDYVLTQLSQFDPTLGIYGLPAPAREHVLLVGGFYQDLGVLVVTGVIDEKLAVAMYYSGIKEVWRSLEPYISGERKIRHSRGMGGMYGSFEHIAVYAETTPYEKLLQVFYRRRSFPLAEIGPVNTNGDGSASQKSENQPQTPEAG
jgi:hypothetical protein